MVSGSQHRAVTADDGCIVFAECRNFKRYSRLSSESDGFLLDDFAGDGESVDEIDLVEALCERVRRGIAVVDAVDVLNEAATPAELLGEEQRRQIGAAAPEEGDASAMVAG